MCTLVQITVHKIQSTSSSHRVKVEQLGEQGWRSGESTRLPPMWPGFDSRTRRHMWVEFVVGSLLCSERFSPPVFPSAQKPTFLNSNSIRNARAFNT